MREQARSNANRCSLSTAPAGGQAEARATKTPLGQDGTASSAAVPALEQERCNATTARFRVRGSEAATGGEQHGPAPAQQSLQGLRTDSRRRPAQSSAESPVRRAERPRLMPSVPPATPQQQARPLISRSRPRKPVAVPGDGGQSLLPSSARENFGKKTGPGGGAPFSGRPQQGGMGPAARTRSDSDEQRRHRQKLDQKTSLELP